MGICCDIIAVTSIPRSAEAGRLKDDRRDAQSPLEAVTAPSCKCRTVYIPSEESEAARDLCRKCYGMITDHQAAEGAALGNDAAPRL